MRQTVGIAVLVLALGSFAAPVAAEGPGEWLTRATARVIDALQHSSVRSSAEVGATVRDRIRTIVDETVNWPETCRQILSARWERLSAREREEFIALFADVTERAYLSRASAWDGETFAMGPLDESIDGQRATVRTNFTSPSRVLPITYRLLQGHDGWKVYDIVIDGISLLSSSRSQIGRLFERFGYGGMMAMLKLKQNQLMIEEQQRNTKVISGVDPNP